MLNKILRKIGVNKDVKPSKDICDKSDFADFDTRHLEIANSISEFTMTSPERNIALVESVKYIVKNEIPGDFVECGVWRGGSLMAIIKTLINIKTWDRIIIGFDTFENGMTQASKFDVSVYGTNGKDVVQDWEKENEYPSLEDVSNYLDSAGYPKKNIKLIKGDIFRTLEKEKIDSISLLRLDTDWYDTTKFELDFLYSKVSKGGVIIVDDYGYWQGARKAVDEFITQNKLPVYLNRVDNTARLIIKP